MNMEILTTPELIDGRLQCNISINSSEIKIINEAVGKYIQDNTNAGPNELTVQQMIELKPTLHELRGILNPS